MSFSSALSTTASVTVPVTVSEEGDFISGTAPTSVTLAASATSAIFTVSTVMDGDNEGSGSVTATVPADTMPSPRWRVGDGVSATVAVTSEDAPSTTPVLSIAGPGYVVEGETLPLRIVSDVYVTQELAVNLGCSVGGGFTVSGGCPASAAIPVGANMVALPITVDNNNIYQTAGGTLTVTIEPSTQNPVSYNLHTLTVNTRKTAIIRDNEIQDNGELTVRFNQDRVVPGQDFQLIYDIRNTSALRANVQLNHSIIGLVPGAYYGPLTLTRVDSGACQQAGTLPEFAPGQTLNISNITINGGDICTVRAWYYTLGSTPTGVYSNRTGDVIFPAERGAPARATFIRGVETPTLTVLPVPTAHVSGPDFVTEGGTYTFRIHSDYEVTRKTSITFSCNTTGGYTVTSSGTEVGDCGQSAVSANVMNQQDFVDIAVTVADNNTEQQSGTLTLAIESPMIPLYTMGSPAAIVVPVVDNDDAPSGSPSVSLSASSYSVDEGDGTVNAEVMLSSQSSSQVVVSYSVLTGPGQTATPGADYVAVPAGDLTFAPNETTKTITITVNDDGTAEDRETFSLTLREPYNATLGTPSSAVMGINLNDGFFDPPLIGISASHASDVNEGDTLTFVLTASRALSQTETVPVGINVSQRGDFLATAVQPSSVDFAPGATTVVFTVNTVDDNDLEVAGSVTVGLLIDSVLVNPRWLVDASAGSATVGVVSEEISGRFDIDSSLILLGEGESRTVRVSLRTLGGSAMTAVIPVELDYAAVPASGADLTGHGATFDPAIVDMDFPAQSGTLTIAAGTQFTDLVVRTINDDVHERRERFVVNFSNPRGAAAPPSPKTIMQIGFNDVVTRELRLERTDGNAPINEGESAQFRVFSDTPVAVDTHVSLTCNEERSRPFTFTGCNNVVIPAGASFVDFTVNVVLDGNIAPTVLGGQLVVTINPRATATSQNPTIYTTPGEGTSGQPTSVWLANVVDRTPWPPQHDNSLTLTFEPRTPVPGSTGVKAHYRLVNGTGTGDRGLRFTHQLGGAGGLIPGAELTAISASSCGASPTLSRSGGLVSVRNTVVQNGEANACIVTVTFNIPGTVQPDRTYTNMTSEVLQQVSSTGGGSLIVPPSPVSVTIEDRTLAVEVTPASVPKGGKMRITYTLTNNTGSNLTDMYFKHNLTANGGLFHGFGESNLTVGGCSAGNVDYEASGAGGIAGFLIAQMVPLVAGGSCVITVDLAVPSNHTIRPVQSISNYPHR